jgi:uncharacterized protein (TIGR02284 family)
VYSAKEREMIGQEGTRDLINRLVRYYFDAKEDYRLAAKRAMDPKVRDELQGVVDRREQFQVQLQQEVTRQGIEMSDNGTVGADFKRDWERVRGSIAGHGYESALGLAAKSEKHAIDTIEQLQQGTLPPTISAMIGRHLVEIRAAYDRLNTLKSQPITA